MYYSYMQVEVINLGGVILLALCARIGFPSHECLQEILFIPILFLDALSLKIPKKFLIFLIYKPTLIIIYTKLVSSYFKSFSLEGKIVEAHVKC